MPIYFQDLTYQSKPIIWSLPKGTTKAQCTYKLVGEKTSIDPCLINEVLASMNVKGIEFINEVAIIPNIVNFKQTYPFNYLLQKIKDNKEQLSSAGNLLLFKSLQEQNSSIPSVPLSPRSNSKLLSPRGHDIAPNLSLSPRGNNIKTLTFDTLLSDYPGETLVYVSDLPQNNDINLKQLSKLTVHSQNSIKLTMQVIKNVDFYFLRQQQIKLIKKLFKEDLIPAIKDFQKGEEPPKYVLTYFAHAVRFAMKNCTYNSLDTGFEACFYNDGQPVPVELNYAIRKIYATKMLESLWYFIKDLPVPVDNNPDLNDWLEKFKKYSFENNKDKLHVVLNSIEQLIICTGLIDHDYKLLKMDSIIQGGYLDLNLLQTEIKSMQFKNTTLKFALDHLRNSLQQLNNALALENEKQYQIDIRSLKKAEDTNKSDDSLEDQFPKLHSMRSIVYSWFLTCPTKKTKSKLSDNGINNLVDETIQLILPLFLACTNGNKTSESSQWISHTIKPTLDSDLYIIEEWKKLLEDKFIAQTRSFTVSKKTPKPDKWQAEIIKAVDFIVEQQNNSYKLENYKPITESSPSCSI